jgi:DNA-binding winged helix-turn-helix (wHTH) protein/Tfp pilus assembly protein PilF
MLDRSRSRDPRAPSRLRLGARLVDVQAGCLMHAGSEVPLRAKTWQLLVFFLTHPDRVCSRDELVAALWPERVVCDDSLVQCVVELRRALGDRERRIIRTIARRGYCFSPLRAAFEWHDGDVLAASDEELAGGHHGMSLVCAWGMLRRIRSQTEVSQARQLFESALQVDDRNPEALCGLALSHVIDVLQRWSNVPMWQATVAEEASGRALAADPASALAHHARAHVAMLKGRLFEAKVGFERALALAPTLAHAHLRLAIIEIETGHAERAAAHVGQALTCTPSGDALLAQAAFVAGMAAFHLGNDEVATSRLEHSSRLNPSGAFAPQWLAAINMLHGNDDRASRLLSRFVARVPGHTIESLMATERSSNRTFRSQRQRLYEGLRRAGLPR